MDFDYLGPREERMMISADAYLLTVAGVVLLVAAIVLFLGLRQKRQDETTERPDVAAE
jgi:hypothetical protein